MMKKILNFYFSYRIIIINQVIGLIGLNLSATQELFVLLTPLNLLITAIIIVYRQKPKPIDKVFWFFVLTTFSIGMLVEIAGVKTGLIFGEYQYSTALGPRLLGVPLVIGINWFILLFSSICTVNYFLPKVKSVLIKIGLAALLMVILDLFIEPFAIHFNLWKWAEPTVPIKNYFAWFGISFGILLPFYKSINQFKNKTAVVAYFALLLFFLLNFVSILNK